MHMCSADSNELLIFHVVHITTWHKRRNGVEAEEASLHTYLKMCRFQLKFEKKSEVLQPVRAKSPNPMRFCSSSYSF